MRIDCEIACIRPRPHLAANGGYLQRTLLIPLNFPNGANELVKCASPRRHVQDADLTTPIAAWYSDSDNRNKDDNLPDGNYMLFIAG